MKKTILFTVLILMVVSLGFSQEALNCKKVKYQDVAKFMADYYTAYNLYAQDAPTMDQMDLYWAPEFLSIQYLPLPQPMVMDRTTWKNFLIFAHLNVTETLTVEELSIDLETLTATGRLSINFNDRSNGQLVLHVYCSAFYNLKADKKGHLKMTALKLYFADPYAVMALSGPPPGM